MKNKENEKIMKQNTCRTIVNIPNDLDQSFREMAIKRGISKSAMIVFAMSWYLDYNKSLDLMPKMIEVLKSAEDLAKKNNK
jgi:hypothetical protein